jgi:hypothetical protein
MPEVSHTCGFLILLSGLIGIVPQYKGNQLEALRLLFVNAAEPRDIDRMPAKDLPVHLPWLLYTEGAGTPTPAPSPAPRVLNCWSDPDDSCVRDDLGPHEYQWNDTDVHMLSLRDLSLEIRPSPLPAARLTGASEALASVAALADLGDAAESGEVDRSCLGSLDTSQCKRRSALLSKASRIVARSRAAWGHASSDVSRCGAGHRFDSYAPWYETDPDDLKFIGPLAEEFFIEVQAHAVQFIARPLRTSAEAPTWTLELTCARRPPERRVDLLNVAEGALDPDLGDQASRHLPRDDHFVWFYDLQHNGQTTKPVPHRKAAHDDTALSRASVLKTKANPRCPLGLMEPVRE